MLKFRRSQTASQASDFASLDRKVTRGSTQLDRKCSFVTSQLGHSKSTVLLRNLSLPLAWPVEEYFGTKKDWREFTVQLGVRSSEGGPQRLSKPLEHINRTFTDVDFPDEFLLSDQGPDFSIELTVYCLRTDEGGVGSMVQNLSRSLGRSIGQSWKRYQQQQQQNASINNEANKGAPNRSFLEELRRAGLREEQRMAAESGRKSSSSHYSATMDENFRNRLALPPLNNMPDANGQMSPIGVARFRLRNATLSGKTHSYSLERLASPPGVSKSQLLPIYGNIGAQLLVQPSSLVSPLAQGSMDVFLSEAGILHQHLRCILQGGQLRCWENAAIKNKQNPSESDQNSLPKLAANQMPLLNLQITKDTRLERTAFPTAFRLVQGDGGRQFLCICPTQRALIGWRNAIQLQQLDITVWAEFAQTQRNPHAAALGTLPGGTPPPFQPLKPNWEHEGNEDELLVQKDEKQDEKKLNDEDTRPRATSSASLLVRNGKLPSGKIPHHTASSTLSASNADLQNDTKIVSSLGEAGMMRPAGPSRLTLVDATHQSPSHSPATARKLATVSPTGSQEPRTALVRRITQQQAKDAATGGNSTDRHISWSLGHGPAVKERGSARLLFQQPTVQQPQIPTPAPRTGIASSSSFRHSALAALPIAEEESSNQQQPGKYVLSLRIDNDEPIRKVAETKVSPVGANRLPASSTPKSTQAQAGITGSSSATTTSTMFGIVPNGKAMSGTSNSPMAFQLIPPELRKAQPGNKATEPKQQPKMGATVAAQQQRPFNINLDFFPSALTNGHSSKCLGSSNTLTARKAIATNKDNEVSATMGPQQRRPFNINLDMAPVAHQQQDDGRWANALVGRSETWHFARTSQACTRL